MLIYDLILRVIESVTSLSAIFLQKRGHEHADEDENGQFKNLVFEGIFNIANLLFASEVMGTWKDHPTLQFLELSQTVII